MISGSECYSSTVEVGRLGNFWCITKILFYFISFYFSIEETKSAV